MRRRRPAMALALLGALLAACDPLLVQPGSALAIRAVDPQPIAISQRVAPVPVAIVVADCARFEVRAIRRDGAAGVFQRLPVTARGDGLHVAEVPVAFLTDARCDADDAAPRRVVVALELTCLDDGRLIESAPIAFEWAAAHRHAVVARPARRVVADPGGAGFFSSSAESFAWHPDGESVYQAPTAFAADSPLHLARDDDGVWVWAGCPQLRCPATTWPGPDGVVEAAVGTVIRRYDLDDGLRSTGIERVVPGEVVGLVAHADGDLTAVSGSQDRVLTTAFTADGDRAVVAHPRRTQPTGVARDLTGAPVFMALDARNPGRAWRYAADGADWIAERVDLPSSPSRGRLDLAPDARHWVLIDGRRIWLSGEGLPWRPVPHDLALLRGVAWIDGALVLHDDDAVEVHPFDLGGAALRVEADDALIESVDATTDGLLALRTTADVRLIAPDGRLLGGLTGCVDAAQTLALTRDHALVLADEHALWFDLVRYREGL